MYAKQGASKMASSKFWFLCAAVAGSLTLAGCGGGSTPATQSASCELPLKYADGANGGYRIGAASTLAVPRQFNACTLTQIQAASVSLCIDHQQISELSAQLVLPNNTTQTLNLQSAQTPGGTCLLTGKLFTMTLSSAALQSIGGLQGDWTVSLTDTNQVSTTPVGYLVGWSLKMDGAR